MTEPPSGKRTEISAREARRFTIGAVIVVCLTYLWFVPSQPDAEMIDHALFRVTVESMRDGSGYYASMDGAFDAIYEEDRAGLIENVRAYRMPTTFWVFALLPSDRWVWALFVLTAGISGVAATYIVKRPVLGLLVTIYLLTLGMFNNGGEWVAQYMATELWAVVPLIGSVAMALRQRWWPAALLALAAMLVRETAGLLLIVAALLSIAGRLPRRPWLAAFGAGGLAYVAHALAVRERIDLTVGYGILDEPSSWTAVLDMAGFGLPWGVVVGPLLLVLAVWHVRKEHSEWVLAAAPLLLPIAGLVIDRQYWGILVVPFAFLWGVERLLDLLGSAGKDGSGVETPA